MTSATRAISTRSVIGECPAVQGGRASVSNRVAGIANGQEAPVAGGRACTASLR